MTQTRFTCTLTGHDEPACQSYARVTITDAEGPPARGCPHRAVAALNGLTGAHVDWADSKGLNEWERQALELAEARSKLAPAPCNQQNLVRPLTSTQATSLSSGAGGRVDFRSDVHPPP